MSSFRHLVFAITIVVGLSTATVAEMTRHNVVFTFSPNKITVVNPKTLESESIPVSNIMWGDVVSSPDHELLFANDRTNNAVQVIGVDSLEVLKSIPVGERPIHTYNPKAGNEIWTHSDMEGAFYVIDIGSLAVKRKVVAASDAAKSGGHGKLLWSFDLGDKAYATNTLDSNLHVLSLSQYRETGTVDTGCKGTHGDSYNIPTKMVYIACNDGHVPVIDPATDTVITTLTGGTQVWPGAHDEWMNERSPFLLSPMRDDMKVIDTRTRTNVGSISLKDTGFVVLHEVAGNLFAFTAGNRTPLVYVMDVKAMKVVKEINVAPPEEPQQGLGEGGGDIVDHGDTLYVVRALDGMLTILDMKEQRRLGSIFIEKGVNHVVYVE
jgi:DNA-binding beta-propeller fold protein YncE